MSELADETDSKSVIRKGVWVQVPPPAPLFADVAEQADARDLKSLDRNIVPVQVRSSAPKRVLIRDFTL